MKKKIDNNSTDWIADDELKKILKIDDFKVAELLLNFDLLSYDIDGNIRHFYEDDTTQLVLEIGSLKFRRKEVDDFLKSNPDLGKSEPGKPALYRERLANRLKNILWLEQIRDQQLLQSTPSLRERKNIIREQLQNSEKVVPPNGLPENVVNLIKKAGPEIEIIYGAIKRVGYSGYVANAEDKWRNAVLDRFKKNEDKFKIIAKDHLLDHNLYSLSSTNAKRDFIGFLLQKIVTTQFGKIGRDKLYDVFKKLK